MPRIRKTTAVTGQRGRGAAKELEETTPDIDGDIAAAGAITPPPLSQIEFLAVVQPPGHSSSDIEDETQRVMLHVPRNAGSAKHVRPGVTNFPPDGSNGINGHTLTTNGDGITTNGTNSSDEADRKSVNSKRSSEGSLRGLPPVPKEDLPPVPKDPPRSMDQLPPRLKARQTAPSKFIPEKEIEIPSEGSIAAFSAEDMTTFFKHIGVPDRIVNHLKKKGLDGQKFSKLRDSDLESIGINNPIVRHFRDKSKKGNSKRLPFML